MITKKNKDIFFQTLGVMYPENRTDLIRSTPRQLLMSVVMSAQTTDKQVNKVTANFFDTIQTPYDTLQLTLEQRSELIKGVNYAPTKAKNLYKTAAILTKERSSQEELPYIIPDTLSELIKLHGVGEKTAKVILHILYNTNDIAVDTHVHRVSNRIGLVKTRVPLQTSKLLDKAIPDKYKSIAHHTMIFFGRYHCTARKPKCQTCPFTKFCIYYKRNEKTIGGSGICYSDLGQPYKPYESTGRQTGFITLQLIHADIYHPRSQRSNGIITYLDDSTSYFGRYFCFCLSTLLDLSLFFYSGGGKSTNKTST